VTSARAGVEWAARGIRSQPGVLEVRMGDGLLRLEGSRRVSPVCSESRVF
jgi:hypothetical protein